MRREASDLMAIGNVDAPAPAKVSITRLRPELDREPDARPLDFGLIRRLLTYTRPYAAKRNWLLVVVVVRAIQLPCVAWVIGAVINGPIAHGAPV
jgi:ATP-binding cassette subfamily B protein